MGVNVVKLGELCEILDSKRKPVTKKDRVAGEYPYYGATGIQDYVADYIFDEKLVLVGEDGAKWGAGENTAYAISGKCWVNNHAHVLRPNRNKVLDNYLIYYLNQLDLRPYITGAIIEKLNQEQLRSIPIPLPTIEEQNRIVSLIDKVDETRAKKKLANDKLDEFLKSTFISMFGDPVKNDKGLSIAKVGELTTLVSSGSTPLGGSSVYQDEGILFIRSQNVLMNKFDFTDIAHISDEIYNSMSRTQVQMNDVLLNITGASIGRIHRYMFKDKANVNQHVCIIRPILDKVSPVYLEYCIGNSNYQHNILRQNSGATRQAFNFEQIKGFKIPLPPIEQQNKFAKIVEHVEAQKQKNELVIEQMNNLFNSLSQRAFKGEL